MNAISPRHHIRIAVAAAVVLAAVPAVAIVSSQSAQAATLAVDTAVDSVDDNPGDGICADAGGDCSLRAAVIEANALAGADTITIATTTLNMLATIAGAGEDAAATGDLDITSEITIQGSFDVSAIGTLGQVSPMWQGSGSFDDRAFEVHAGASLTISGGLYIGNFHVTGDGGAISNHGTLTLRDDDHPGVVNGVGYDHQLISGTSATGNGGAVFNDAGAGFSWLGVTTTGGTTRIVGTSATNGGGIYNLGTFVMDGQASGRDVYLDNATATDQGGGVYNGPSATMTLACRAMIRFGNAEFGGNIYNLGTVDVDGGYVDGGTAVVAGGGVFNDTGANLNLGGCDGSSAVFGRNSAPLGGAIYTVSNVTPKGNVAIFGNGLSLMSGSITTILGGAIYVAAGGVVKDAAATPIQITGNFATDGAGVYVADQGHFLLNGSPGPSGGSSVSGNVASGNGGGIYAADGADVDLRFAVVDGNTAADGGGVWTASATTTLSNSRVGASDAGGSSSGNSATAAGGGVFVDTTGAITLDRVSLVSNRGPNGGSAIESNGEVDATNVTIDDTGTDGPAIRVGGGVALFEHMTAVSPVSTTTVLLVDGAATIRASLFASGAIPCDGGVVSAGDNVSVTEGCLNDSTDALTPLAADVAPLQYGGGVTEYRALQTSNPAIDHVVSTCAPPAVDQVGNTRPADGDGNGSANCDAGAHEFTASGGGGGGGGKPFMLSGTIYDERDGSPLSTACVTNLQEDSVHTDADGHWTLWVEPGPNLLIFYPCAADNDPDFTGPLAPEWWQNRALTLGSQINPVTDGAVELVVTQHMSGLDACLAPAPGPGTAQMPCFSSPPVPTTTTVVPDPQPTTTLVIAEQDNGTTTTTTRPTPATELPRTGGGTGNLLTLAALLTIGGAVLLATRRTRPGRP